MAITNIKTEMNEKADKAATDKSDKNSSKEDRDDRRGGFNRKKVCRFCSDQDFLMDYKDFRMMQSFMSEHGKITPRRISGNCAQHQRKLTTSVKRARNLALVGYVSMGN